MRYSIGGWFSAAAAGFPDKGAEDNNEEEEEEEEVEEGKRFVCVFVFELLAGSLLPCPSILRALALALVLAAGFCDSRGADTAVTCVSNEV